VHEAFKAAVKSTDKVLSIYFKSGL